MKYTDFHESQFRRSVNDAMQSVDRILSTDRHPRLAGDVDHTYQNKYDLANLLTNTSVIAIVNVLERLGLDAELLRKVAAQAKSSKRAATLRFEATDRCEFLMEQRVEVPSDNTIETKSTTESTGIFGSTQKTSITRVVRNVVEYHWKVTVHWKLSVYVGTLGEWSQALQERTSSAHIITQTNKNQPPSPPSTSHDPFEVSLTWLLDQIDADKMTAQFAVDVEDEENTRTPRQNKQVEEAIRFWDSLSTWSRCCDRFFVNHIQGRILVAHNPAKPSEPSNDKTLADITTKGLFCPIQPLMDDSAASAVTEHNGSDEEVESKSLLALPTPTEGADMDGGNTTPSPLLSPSEMYKLLNEHVRSLDHKMTTISKHFPAKQLVKLISIAEADFTMLCRHIKDLRDHYANGVGYIEMMLKNQLKAAIGKEVQADDLDLFMKHHNSKLLKLPPRPFCHAIRRPQHYPDGVLSIETASGGGDQEENTPIDTLAQKVETARPLEVPLNAAVTIELTGPRYLHGWMQHRFEHTHKSYQLVARARQFSSFVLLVGKMTGPNSISPKDAIILQNKDELIIPLLLEELPSSKEFKDAIQSLSPEQQRFAKSFRSMQLESSVLGVCIIQIKPQLEALLGLPSDALTKEMKLTQDLTQLFVEYQVPSDLLSYDGASSDGDDGELIGAPSMKEKVASVKGYVKAVLDVVEAEKKKQLDEQKMKADMAKSQFLAHHPEPPSREIRYRSSARSSRSTSSSMEMALACSAPIPFASPAMAMADVAFDAAPAPMAVDRTSADGGEFDDFCEPEIVESGDDQTHRNVVELNEETNETDFTLIPKILDKEMGEHDKDNALRSTIIKTTQNWTRKRQDNLLTKAETAHLDSDDIRSEKNKAFDLLDALSRSGSLPIACSELHVVIAVTHGFENDVMGTVIQDNINPIEKLEKSTLLMASTIYGVPPRELVRDASEVARLSGSFPALFSGIITEA